MNITRANGGEKTQVLFGQHDVVEKWKQCAYNTKSEINIYADSNASLETLGFKNYLSILNYLKEKGVRIRYITEITKENMQFCKSLMGITQEFRHLDGIRGAFSVTDNEFLATATLQEVKPVSHAIYSNSKQLVDVQMHIFETLWNRSIQAERKLKEIEQGIEAEFVEAINNPQRSTEIITSLASSINSEALLLIPKSKSMTRLYKLGLFDELIKSSKRKARIRMICPIDDENSELVKYLRVNSNIEILNGTEGAISLFLIDQSRFFISEVHEETAKELSKTLGFGLFSNSISLIQSFRLFFDLVWKSDELNEKLKDHERMQAEFINIASHEIKTPIQSILTYSELIERPPEKDLIAVESIQRNAKRLMHLSNKLLDLTRIQSNTLIITKESIDITNLISKIVEDFRIQIKSKYGSLPSIKLEFDTEKTIMAYADKERVSQIISNLIHNAIKFTQEGKIAITVTETKDQVTVSIKDTGVGIDPNVFPNLFTKFTTTLSTGTGVGLYISKSIVEAHGGKIYGKNNNNGKGATFSFTLPLK